MREMIAVGQIAGQTQVWREGMNDWRPLLAVPELCAGYPWLAVNPGAQVAATSGMAIASMVCGIVGLLLILVACGMLSGLTAVPGVVLGHMAMRTISRSEKPVGGRGMAIAGLVMNYLGILAQLAAIGFFAFAFLSAGRGVGP
jgi:hypothetical protein